MARELLLAAFGLGAVTLIVGLVGRFREQRAALAESRGQPESVK